MDLPTLILLYVLLVTAGQGLVLGGIVAAQRPRHVSFGYLALFFVLMSLGCGEKAVEGIFYPPGAGELPIPFTFPLAYLPAIYLHLRHLMAPAERFRWSELWHFTPAVLMEFAAYYLVPGEGIYGGFVLIQSPEAVREFFRTYDLIFSLHFFFYTIVLVKVGRQLASKSEDHVLRVWLRRLLPTLITFWVSWVLVKFIGKWNPLGYAVSYLVHGAAIVSIYGAGFSFILQMRAKFMRLLASPLARPKEPMTRPEATAVIGRLRDTGLFRKQKLTLAQAAAELGLAQRALTEAVLEGGHGNFSELVNQLRVDAFKQLAQEPGARRMSLFGLAQEVGFASKASFHRTFKKHCGQTPREFVDTAAISPAASGATGA
ncbi:helix-turn-helix transcriptional regulator [Actomonas aquatica]|uniref:Helix-turn-helix domain-containing protein n=1 Tax=Actomonas aquatica TaxID=2866162 RepID=A0ABZ1CDQ3_9BACT|nr:helix-turn-helix domain-containing protein [Opitutus sp. WL0086]WRQ89736.1 helix-turn-helix domain-containing protein [Opitutus sp. WL0086]